MFSSIQHFTGVWESEAAATISCFEKLTDESLTKDLVHDHRSIQRLANHIINCTAGIPHEAGFPVVGYENKEYKTAAEIVTAYKAAVEMVKQALQNCTDNTLQEESPMYGETWKKGFSLWVTVMHQIHHRGQLTILMRLAGLPVPGVYGPSKEEWEAMGLPQAD